MDLNRKTSYEVLFDIGKNNAYSNISLNEHIIKNKPNSESYVREIVYGVLKNKYLLDDVISKFLTKGIKSVGLRELTLLRMGAYELLLINTPSYAAISETVNLSKVLLKNKSGFINGVLRNIDRNRDNISFSNDLTKKYSINKWILDNFISWYGLDKTIPILEESNKTPKLSIRTNISKITRDELVIKLNELGFDVEIDKNTSTGLFVKGKGLISSELFKSGYFSIQDISSQMVISNLEYINPKLMIDLCAAPGGKSLAFKEKYIECSVISCDIFMHKLKLIENEAKRLGVEITTKLNDGRNILSEYVNEADIVLVDAPCSGFGVLRRKPEIKYKEEFNLKELVNIQRDILNISKRYVKDNGMLVYSTCTINPDENEKQIEKFLESNSDFIKIKEINLLPSDISDGFYICYLRRINCK